MVDQPVTCKLLSHSIACHPPSVSKKKKISEVGPKWADDKSAEFCQSCGFQFNILIRRHHCRHCGMLSLLFESLLAMLVVQFSDWY